MKSVRVPLRICSVIAALVVTSCSSGGGSTADAPATTNADPSDLTTDFADGANEQVIASAGNGDPLNVDGFDPSIVDEALVPITVEEVLLDDDVIIATEDGRIPTVAAEPPPSGDDTLTPLPDSAPTTTVAPAAPPAATEVQRIVSLSPTHTETVATLGAADLLVGIDVFSDAPAGAPIQSDQFVVDDLATETIQALRVDLVILGDDRDGLGAQSLAAAGIPFFDGARPSTRAGVEQQILDLAQMIDRAAAGQQLVTSMQLEVADIIASLPATDGLTYFHEIDPGLATYAPGSLVDSLYRELGLTSIVPEADYDTTFIDNDTVVAGNPDVVVLGDIACCAATAERASARTGWSDLSATQNGAIVEVPDDIANRFGTNIVELMRLVATGVAAAA